jgi:hypothetical protein
MSKTNPDEIECSNLSFTNNYSENQKLFKEYQRHLQRMNLFTNIATKRNIRTDFTKELEKR